MGRSLSTPYDDVSERHAIDFAAAMALVYG